ncbi:hypothetical protein GCM10027589_11000 [Actinocorallia lasiicapitis]
MKKVLGTVVPLVLLLGIAPAPAHAAVPARKAVPAEKIDTRGTPSSIELKINGVFQRKWWWCSPTTGALSLSTMGIKVDQKVLARKMKTSEAIGGTWDSSAVRALNPYAAKKGYRYTLKSDVHKPAQLAKRVVHDVGRLRKAVPLQVYMARLPWYKGQFKKDVGHIILAYGYNKKTRTIRIWDPYNYLGTGGTHDVPLDVLAKATQSNSKQRYAGIYYITKR